MKTTRELLKIAYNTLDEKKGIDIQILDIGNLTPICDYFLIAAGSSHNQVQALCDYVQEALAKEGCHPRQVEGLRGAGWVLLDYQDFVVHVFTQEERSFYHIEKIWQDGTPVDPETL